MTDQYVPFGKYQIEGRGIITLVRGEETAPVIRGSRGSRPALRDIFPKIEEAQRTGDVPPSEPILVDYTPIGNYICTFLAWFRDQGNGSHQAGRDDHVKFVFWFRGVWPAHFSKDLRLSHLRTKIPHFGLASQWRSRQLRSLDLIRLDPIRRHLNQTARPPSSSKNSEYLAGRRNGNGAIRSSGAV